MKDRLIQLLDLEQLSPSKFADIIGVQRSSISHVLSGRNKPSFDFLQKTLKAFPGLNATWLMMGEGSMYEQMGRNVTGNLFDSPEAPGEQDDDNIPEETLPQPEAESSAEPFKKEEKAESPVERKVQDEALPTANAPGNKKIVQVVVIYEDDTFRAFTPAK